MMKILIFNILIVSVIFEGISQEKVDSILNVVEKRISVIEEYRTIDEKRYDLFTKEIGLKIREYKQDKTLLDFIAIGVGGFTLFSLFGFWQKVKVMAKKKIEERFDVILQEKKSQLIKIIDGHDDEEKLKKSKIIRIITSEDSDSTFLVSFFRKFGFKNVDIMDVGNEYSPIPSTDNYDLLFLNREEGNSPLNDKISGRYIDDLPKDSIVFSFGKFIKSYNESAKKRFASATNWSQLYGNLVSALKFQELIDKK